MLAAVLARLLPYKLGALAAVLAVLALAIVVQTVRLDAARASLAAKSETIDALNQQLVTQNAAIEAMHLESQRRDQLAADANAVADKALAKAKAEVARIKASGPKEDTCDSALQWLVDEVQEQP